MGEQNGLTTFTQTVFSVVTAMVGVGVVGLPYALAHTGWFMGVLLITIAMGLAIYGGTLLALCMNNSLPGHRMTTYMELGDYAIGPLGRALGWYASMGCCFAASTFFVVAAIEQFQVLFPTIPLTPGLWASVFCVVVLPLCYIKTLGHATVVSFIGASTSAITMVLVTVLIVYDYLTGKTQGLDTHTTFWVPGSLTALNKALVTIIFSLGGMCVFPEVSRCMQRPEDFGKAVAVACGLSYVFYLALACSGYGLFGQHLLASVEYANVVKMLSNNLMAKTIATAMLLHIVAGFVVTIMPIFRYIEDKYNIETKSLSMLWRVLARTTVVAGCLLVAVLVPFFGDIMAFVGATMDSLSGIILPCFFYVILFYRRDPLQWLKGDTDPSTPLLAQSALASPQDIEAHRRHRPGRAQAVFTVCLGTVMVGVALLGTHSALMGIVARWQGGEVVAG